MTSAHDRAMVERLRATAEEAMRRAYAPYSGFRVGAALLGRDGGVFPGCNVENAGYSSTICAERTAVTSAVVRGVRELELLVLVTESDEPTPPCGVCRQVLVEFAPDLPVISFAGGREARWNLAELLPHPFTPASLGRV